jgi:hypothetical protein
VFRIRLRTLFRAGRDMVVFGGARSSPGQRTRGLPRGLDLRSTRSSLVYTCGLIGKPKLKMLVERG